MKKLIELKLKWLAKMILAKYKPEIIGVTGSVGKTSTKEAIYTVLKDKYQARRSRKNYNNEIGVPLTIIDSDSPGKSLLGWCRVFFKGLGLIIFTDKRYPKIIIQEMGVDRPGDMEYLNSIVNCKIGVLTYVGTVHAKYFKSRSELRKEKEKLIESVDKSGWSLVNYDNEDSRKAKEKSRAKILTYGLDKKADVIAQEIKFSFDQNKDKQKVEGVNFKLTHKGASVPVHLPRVLGTGAIYSALAAAAAGIAKGMNLIEISQSLENYRPPKGRMNVIAGIKGTTILDDSYNSEPASARAAAGILKRIPSKGRKLAALGDMLELGKYSEPAHRELGKYAFKCGVKKLFLVGERARDIGRGAQSAGMKRDDIFHFEDSISAGKFIQDRLRENDLILIKGSQGKRMEKIVLEIMAEPLRAKELLVRQDEEWLKSKN